MNTKEKNVQEYTSVERDILPFISSGLKVLLRRMDTAFLKNLEEIRLRADKPIMFYSMCKDWFANMEGHVSQNEENPFITKQEDLIKTIELMSENSIYAYREEIKNGFITLKGGHRVGICGKAVVENNNVKNIKDISGLNIRVSKEVKGCSSNIIRFILDGSGSVYNTLIISPPQCGKTTMLRDLTRVISDGDKELTFRGLKVGVVDERSELAACYRGIPQNSVGMRTDVLDGCPKIVGMDMMLRSMSPQVIVTDEIGNQGDCEAVMKVVNAGVKIITTAHGYNISQLKTRQEVLRLIQEKVFERYIVLSGDERPGTLMEVVDGKTLEKVYGSGAKCF